MITEDYVSFETAKLLKEKEFNEECEMAYFNKTLVDYTMFGFCLGGDLLYCPTLQMAMKWLREVHKIEVRVIYDNDKSSWYGACNPMNELSKILLGFNCKSNSYEEACESAIKYCLKNLI